MPTSYRYYTNREMRHIRENWQTKTDQELAADLNRTPESIKNFRQRFRLLRKEEPLKTETL